MCISLYITVGLVSMPFPSWSIARNTSILRLLLDVDSNAKINVKRIQDVKIGLVVAFWASITSSRSVVKFWSKKDPLSVSWSEATWGCLHCYECEMTHQFLLILVISSQPRVDCLPLFTQFTGKGWQQLTRRPQEEAQSTACNPNATGACVYSVIIVMVYRETTFAGIPV